MRGMAPRPGVGPLDWLGPSIAAYLDDDPLWDEAKEAKDASEFMEQQPHRLPLALPRGGTYAWNEEWRTMESTVYGHPGQPKAGRPAPPQLSRLLSGNFGVTFEQGGLRARVVLQRETP